MPNFDKLAYKLQRALISSGRKITINQVQIYSNAKNRMVTRYKLREDGELVFESWNMIDVVKYLAGELGESA